MVADVTTPQLGESPPFHLEVRKTYSGKTVILRDAVYDTSTCITSLFSSQQITHLTEVWVQFYKRVPKENNLLDEDHGAYGSAKTSRFFW